MSSSRRNGSVSRAAEAASKNRLHMDRNPQHSRLTDPSNPVGRRKEIDNVMKRARQASPGSWDRKLLEVEEKDPNRWRHTGYKKMYIDGSKSPSPRRSPGRRSRSPLARRSRSPLARRSRSPLARRSRSPLARRSRSPLARRSRSPLARRSRSPLARRSRSPLGRRSPRKSRSRSARRSPRRSPVRRSPVRRGSVSRARTPQRPRPRPPRPARDPVRPPSPTEPRKSSPSGSSTGSCSDESCSVCSAKNKKLKPGAAKPSTRSPPAAVRPRRPPPPRPGAKPPRPTAAPPRPGAAPPRPAAASAVVQPTRELLRAREASKRTREEKVLEWQRSQLAVNRPPPGAAPIPPARIKREGERGGGGGGGGGGAGAGGGGGGAARGAKERGVSPAAIQAALNHSDEDEESDASDDGNANRLTLSERFGKMAQWSAARGARLENMRITRRAGGPGAGGLQVRIEPGEGGPGQGEQGEIEDAPIGSYPEELLAVAPSGLPSWDDVTVRYDYYKKRGYLRGLTLGDYVKWEEWWYKYQEWLKRERAYERWADGEAQPVRRERRRRGGRHRRS